MNVPRRDVPTPRARRIWEEIESLTLYDLLYLRDKMLETLGRGDDATGTSGVREPRRPQPSSGSASATVVPIYENTDSVWFGLGDTG